MKSTFLQNMVAGSAIAVISLGATAHETANETRDDVRFIGETEYAGFCKAVVQDDVSVLEKNVNRYVGKLAGSREAVLERVTAKDGLLCNGDNLIVFAERRGAQAVHRFLSGRQGLK